MGRAGRTPGPNGKLGVVTTKMKAGYLRKNGVPYSEKHKAAGVLRYLHRAGRHVMARRHLDHHGPDESHRSVRDDESLQEDSRYAGLGSDRPVGRINRDKSKR
jgi:hypothetical protein